MNEQIVDIWRVNKCKLCSVKETIERYKKACSDSSNNGSISEANAQVHFQI